MQEVPINRLGGLSLPRKSMVMLTDRPDMTLDVYRGCKTTTQQQQTSYIILVSSALWFLFKVKAIFFQWQGHLLFVKYFVTDNLIYMCIQWNGAVGKSIDEYVVGQGYVGNKVGLDNPWLHTLG